MQWKLVVVLGAGALSPLLPMPSEWSCGVPNQLADQGQVKLRLLAGKQDQSQQVEASRSISMSVGSTMDPDR